VAFPDASINTQTQGGDSAFENLYVFGKLNYDFDQDDIKIRSIDISEPSTFQKSVTLSGDLNLTGNAAIVGDVSLDELTARNVNITGIVTTSGDLYVSGRFRDVNSATGTAGQILSSTGNGVDWIDANTTSVNNSINVGVNVDSTNADQFVSFFGANSGNQPNRVDNDFKYNPSTNLLKIDGTAGGIVPSGAIILWSGAANAIPTGYVICNGNNGTPDLRARFVIGVGDGSAVGNSNYNVNDTGGAEFVTLTLNQIPSHTHTYIDQYVVIDNGYRPWPANNNDCAARNVNSGSAGGGQSHENRPPYYALCYIMKT
tara:strand:- start:794 stop:1738 length:945 start_codon:yes stop_codon:yes gene_type:complete